MNREPGITVTHEDLQWVLTAITTPLGGLHLYKNCHQRPGRVQLDAEMRPLCFELQSRLDATAEREIFAEVLWVPGELKEVVSLVVGC